MAKKAYVGVANTAANVVKQYIGVSNVARKIVKGYVGVNNVAQQFWDDSVKQGSGIWDFYSTIAETIIEGNCNDIPNPIWVEVDKTNAGIAFYFIMPNYPVDQSAYYDPWHYVVTLSTDQSAVSYTYDGWDGTTRSCQVSSFTYNGETWYYGYATPLSFVTKPVYPNDYIPDCLMDYYYDAGAGIVDNIMPMIYSDDFAEDYQIGQSYTLSYGSIEKTLRKVIGIFLFKNVSLKSNASYSALLANIETIVTNVLNDIGSNKIVNFDIFSTSGVIRLNYRYTNANIPSKQIIQKTGDNDYTCYEIQTSIDTDVAKFVYINQDGNISYRDGITQPINYLGVYLNSYSGTLMLSNIGLDL